jgi:alanine dehydrogenase
MPGADARTSTQALENSTLPFSLAIASKGYQKALRDDKHLLAGLNVIDGKVVYRAVADALGHKYFEAEKLV